MTTPILTPGPVPNAEPKPVAKVEFALLSNGQVMARSAGPRLMVLGVIDEGRDLLKGLWAEQDAKKAEGPGIEVAPASFLENG